MRRVRFAVFLQFLLLAALAACGGGGNGGGGVPAPVITAFTATPATVNQGQGATLSWTVSGATNFSISPGVGTVTGISVAVTPVATTTYVLTATGAGGSASASTMVTVVPLPPSVERTIDPRTTDPAIATYLNPHVAINPEPSVAPRNALFLFLPGTGGQPANQRLIVRTGAARGYHAIGLMYPNTPSVGSLCNDSADPDAHWKARREICTGENLSSLVDVAPVESIEHRLETLLAYLHASYPTEGWGGFLIAGKADWSKLVVAGHSQGGGHAGVLAKLHPLLRAVCFSSPADWRSPVNQPASWYAQAGATPASRIYGFSHLQDELVPWSELNLNWSALGLAAFGPAVSVDTTAAPYGSSHQLSSNADHGTVSPLYPAPFHSATVVDAATPVLGDGSPRYRPVWIQLCFP